MLSAFINRPYRPCQASLHTGSIGVLLTLLLLPASWGAAQATKPSDRDQRLNERRDARLNEEVGNLYRMADATYLVGDLNRAAELFSRVLAIAPNSPFVIRAQARLGDCAFEGRRYDQAAGLYRRAAAAIETAPAGEESDAAIRSGFMVGQSYLSAKQYTTAFGAFRRFIDKNPQHALANHAYQAIGDAHLAQDQYQQALAAYRMVGTVLSGNSAVSKRISPGERLYLRVTDADVNVGETPRSVTAIIRTTAGDEEIVELEPLGQRSSVFLASIPTALGPPRHGARIRGIFSETRAAELREMLVQAGKQETTGKARALEATELEQSPQRVSDPAGIEKRRKALADESAALLASAAEFRRKAFGTVDSAFTALEKVLDEWAPEQNLAAIAAATTRPATTQASAPATAPADEARGLSEAQLQELRLTVRTVPTTMENIDGRLTALSIWSRQLFRQFQRLELSGSDQITVDYVDEIGPKGPNAPEAARRRQVLEVASDGQLSVLSPDGQQAMTQAVLGASILLRVADADADRSAALDTITVVLATQATPDPRALEVATLVKPATKPTTQRATPGAVEEMAPATQPVEQVPLIPPGAPSIRVTLKETAPHSGIFERDVLVDKNGISADGQNLPIAAGQLLRPAYQDDKAMRHPDGTVLATTIDCIADQGGDVRAVRYRVTQLDLQAKLRRAAASGEIGKVYLDLGLTARGKSYLESAQADCADVAAAAAKTQLGEDALYHSWRIYFYAGLLDEAVASARQLMTRYPQSEYIDDAMFALGQASLKLGEAEVEKNLAEGKKASMNRDLQRALSQFDDMVRRYPASPLAPESLYLASRAKVVSGQTGLDTLEQLAKKYPDSTFAAKGLKSAADYYVSVGDFTRAADYFNRVIIDHPDSDQLNQCLLNRGICQYKLAKNAEALASLYRVAEEQAGTPLAAEAQKYIHLINQQRPGEK